MINYVIWHSYRPLDDSISAHDATVLPEEADQDVSIDREQSMNGSAAWDILPSSIMHILGINEQD